MSPEYMSPEQWEEMRRALSEESSARTDRSSWRDVTFETGIAAGGLQRYSFNASLDRLRAAGFERHARTHEYFGAYIPALHGCPHPTLEDVCADMGACSHMGEWVSMAIERRKESIVIHSDPEGFAWSQSMHVPGRPLRFSDRAQFPFIPSTDAYTLLDGRHNALLEYLCGTGVSGLPPSMHSGDTGVFLAVPAQGILQPAFVMFRPSGCLINAAGTLFAASRGVRERRGGP